MNSAPRITLITFQEKKVISELNSRGIVRVPESFTPKAGNGSLFNPDFNFGYNWIKTKMKIKIGSYQHNSFPYWCIYLPKELQTKERLEEIKEVFCEPGRKILILNVPVSECFFSSFDLFDGYILRKRFLGSDEETLNFYRNILSKNEYLELDNLNLYDQLPNKMKAEIINSFSKAEIPFDEEKIQELILSGDFVQVTIPEIRKEFLIK